MRRVPPNALALSARKCARRLPNLFPHSHGQDLDHCSEVARVLGWLLPWSSPETALHVTDGCLLDGADEDRDGSRSPRSVTLRVLALIIIASDSSTNRRFLAVRGGPSLISSASLRARNSRAASFYYV